MHKKKFNSIIWKEGSWYVAKLVGIELASQGKTKREAVKNLTEALELFLEDEKLDTNMIAAPSKVETATVYA